MNSPTVACPAAIDRRCDDRRAAPRFFSFWQLGLNGRRSGGRRAADLRGPLYVDRYDARIFFSALCLLLLSAMDAAFTLNLISKGAVELNSFMAVLLHDPALFVTVKLLLTGLALIFLVIHDHYRIGKLLRVRHVQYALLIAYATLIGYEIALLRVAYA